MNVDTFRGQNNQNGVRKRLRHFCAEEGDEQGVTFPGALAQEVDDRWLRR